jgi:subtilisin family serine protease
MRETRSPWLPLLAGAVFALSAGEADAQYSMRAPSMTVAPRITPMAPVTPSLRPQIHYNLMSDQDGPAQPPRKPPTAQGPSGPNGPSSAQNAPRRAAPVTAAAQVRSVPNEVVIEVAGSPSDAQVTALASRHRLTRMESQPFGLTNSTYFRWQIRDGRSVSDVVAQLRADPTITSVQPNQIFTLNQSAVASLPRSAGDPSQYAVGKLRLKQAHGLSRGENVLVAVIDSAIDVSHPELIGVIAGTFDPLQSDEGPHAHGTGVAGLIAGHARLTGAAPSSQILAVRAFAVSGKSAEGNTFAILKSLEWSVSRGARIINMSFAGPNDPAIGRALAGAHKKGVVLIAAAGNAGPKSPPLFPASDPNVIAVSATDIDDKIFSASNRGKHVAITAPGVDILVSAPDGAYTVASGTSFSAPQVSGIAALLLSRKPNMTPDEVRDILMSTARDLGPKGRDDQFGAGLVDAMAALSAIAPASIDTAGRPQPIQVSR